MHILWPPDGLEAPVVESLNRIGMIATVTFAVCLAGAGCGPPDMDSLVSFTDAGQLKAYAFEVTNVTDSPISGIHLLLKSDPSTMPPQAPRHWSGDHDTDGLHFVTPPSDVVGSRAKRPIPPGRAVGPFRFCLGDEPAIERILFDHPDGSTTAASDGSVAVGGVPLEAASDGTIALRPARDVYSFNLRVNAPEGRPVSRVQFQVVGEGAIDGAVTGPEWHIAPSDGKITCWAPGDRTPIRPGESRNFTLCADQPKLEIEWSLVGLDQNTIVGGTTSLAIASP